MNWKKDRGLQLRMGLLLVSLLSLYVIFLGAIGIYLNNFLISSIVVGSIVFAQFWYGPNIALRISNAQRVSATEYPELHQRVVRISQQADMAVPDIAVSKSKTPNAFASGRSSDSAVICVTEKLISELDGDELDAVIAHELAHIKNNDVAIMMIASTLSAMSFFVVRWGFLADGGDSGNTSILAAVMASFVVWVLSYFVIRIMSQYREFAADRGGVAITGNPSALASALKTISDTVQETPKEDLRKSATMNSMNFFEVETESHMTKWFNTHPSVEERINKLRQIESEN
mgnify:CR=1 FL=1